MQRKIWYVFHFGVGRHASFPQKPVVNMFCSLGFRFHSNELALTPRHFSREIKQTKHSECQNVSIAASTPRSHENSQHL